MASVLKFQRRDPLADIADASHRCLTGAAEERAAARIELERLVREATGFEPLELAGFVGASRVGDVA